MTERNALVPEHYDHPSGLRCRDLAQFMTFPMGNVLKYVWRGWNDPSGKGIESLRKALRYVTIWRETVPHRAGLMPAAMRRNLKTILDAEPNIVLRSIMSSICYADFYANHWLNMDGAEDDIAQRIVELEGMNNAS